MEQPDEPDLPRTFAGLDEPRLERDGRYAAVIAGSGVYGGTADEYADGGDAAAAAPSGPKPRRCGATSFNSDLSAPGRASRCSGSGIRPGAETQFGPSVGVYVHGAGSGQDDVGGRRPDEAWVV